MSQIRCQIEQITPLNNSVFQVILRPETPMPFKAGQYLSVVMSDDDKRPFSIASSPLDKCIELHIGASVPESYPMQVITRLQSEDHILIEGPNGVAFLQQESERPRILVAGGTGFSYVHSMIDTLLRQGDQRTTYLYWGARNIEAMYMKDLADNWAEQYPHLHFVSIFDEAIADQRQGSVIDAVCEDFVSLQDFDLYIAGRFDMAKVARERFCALDLPAEQLFGDAFAFIK